MTSEKYGPFRRDEETSAKIKQYFCKTDLGATICTALLRFSELETFGGIAVERISLRELQYRFKAIRDTGFPVQPYSSMNKQEAWKYWRELKRAITRQAEKICSDILAKVEARNLEQKSETYELR